MKHSSLGSVLAASALLVAAVPARADDPVPAAADATAPVAADATTSAPQPSTDDAPTPSVTSNDPPPAPLLTTPAAGAGGDEPQATDPITVTTGPSQRRQRNDASGGATTDPVPDVQATDPSLIGPGALEVQAVPNFFIEDFDIPPFLLPIYQAAGSEYGIRWEVLASINRIETAFGTNLNVSSAGALGWMQFMPSTWEQYGVDANGDGEKDPFNPADAIFAAARYLKAAGGDVDLRKAVFAYNHADWYVNEVMDGASQIASIPEPIISSLAALTQGSFPVDAPDSAVDYAGKLQATADAKHTVKPGEDASDTVSGSASVDGIEIHAPAGARAVAVADGVVEEIGSSAELGTFVRLRDAYGNRYTYAHLGSVQQRVPVPKPVKDTGDHQQTDDGASHAHENAKGDAPAGTTPASTTPADAPASTSPARGDAGSDDATSTTPRDPKPTTPASERTKPRATTPKATTPDGTSPQAPAPGATTPRATTPPSTTSAGTSPTTPAEHAEATTPAGRPEGTRHPIPEHLPPAAEPSAAQQSAASTMVDPDEARRLADPAAAYAADSTVTTDAASASATTQPTKPNSLAEYFSIDYGLGPDDVTLRKLRPGTHVIAGTVLGRLAQTGDAALTFQIRPGGKAAPLIDPKPILDGWRLMDRTAFYKAQRKANLRSGGAPTTASAASDTSAGQVLLMSKPELQQRVLADKRISIYECGRRDIKAGLIDRRILALLEYLAVKGIEPTVTALECGHSLMTSSGNISEHSTGTAVDIGSVYGTVITPATQGAGSVTDRAVQEILKLQGAMKPHQIITLMQYAGTDNTLALPDHDDHIHVGYRPASGNGGGQLEQLIKPGQWGKLLEQLDTLDVPKVRTSPSAYAVDADAPTTPGR